MCERVPEFKDVSKVEEAYNVPSFRASGFRRCSIALLGDGPEIEPSRFREALVSDPDRANMKPITQQGGIHHDQNQHQRG
jgi:hypothetical protein